MKIIFLDTNIIIDFLADRRPFSVSAAKIFNASLSGNVKVFVSSVSFNNIYYILRQSLSHPKTIDLLNELSEMTEIVDVTKTIVRKSLHSTFKDFEDAIQYHCALTVSSIDFIVTRDIKGFKESILPVMNLEEALSIINVRES